MSDHGLVSFCFAFPGPVWKPTPHLCSCRQYVQKHDHWQREPVCHHQVRTEPSSGERTWGRAVARASPEKQRFRNSCRRSWVTVTLPALSRFIFYFQIIKAWELLWGWAAFLKLPRHSWHEGCRAQGVARSFIDHPWGPGLTVVKPLPSRGIMPWLDSKLKILDVISFPVLSARVLFSRLLSFLFPVM